MTGTLTAGSFEALGTTATVVVDGDDRALAAALDAVHAELAAIDVACSRFRPDSELSRLNAAAGQPVTASPLLLDAVAVALRAARITGGLIDPTIGGSLRRLGYDRDFRAIQRGPRDVTERPKAPPPAPVVTLRTGPVPGWQVVRVDRARRMITVPAGVELDLGATAKALAADRAAAAAHRAARRGVLVSLGGDVAVGGAAPDEGWSIRATDDHAAAEDAPGQTISITTGGLATSGTTVRRWRQGATVVHHLVDPATGRPATGNWRTVSVAAASCVDANTASTAAVILGPGAAEWLLAQGLPSRLVAEDGTVTTVAGWPEP